MRKADILSVITGKLGPLVLVFGAYLIAYGHISPGGGFQGGVVLASGVLLIAIGQGTDAILSRLTTRMLAQIEAVAFALLLVTGLAGMMVGKGFFGNFLAAGNEIIKPVGFIIALNILIGIKVGAGIAYLCLILLRDAER
ncbi:MAG TPA: MnhB domain-containing protein [Magnetospirillaceae bacterium]|nr:MnhB domain-containing protein [Magnetospirillaceae bacterium]